MRRISDWLSSRAERREKLKAAKEEYERLNDLAWDAAVLVDKQTAVFKAEWPMTRVLDTPELWHGYSCARQVVIETKNVYKATDRLRNKAFRHYQSLLSTD